MRRASTLIVIAAALAALSAAARPRVVERVIAAPDMVELAPHDFLYPLAGNFTRGGKPAAVPLRDVRPPHSLAIMRRQVSAADYRRCIVDGGCPDAPDLTDDGERPAVTVSWRDATAYAAWLSRHLGATYRLPTDDEWAFAAGSRFTPLAIPATGDDPAAIALAQYEREATLAAAEAVPDANENGLLGLAGIVAEWTDTCYRHVELDALTAPVVNCGLRVVEGRHRTYMPDFIRNPRAGGCAIGTPPRNLGFRLVREDDVTGWRRATYFFFAAS